MLVRTSRLLSRLHRLLLTRVPASAPMTSRKKFAWAPLSLCPIPRRLRNLLLETLCPKKPKKFTAVSSIPDPLLCGPARSFTGGRLHPRGGLGTFGFQTLLGNKACVYTT